MTEKDDLEIVETASEKMYKSLFEFSNEGIFIVDKETQKIIDVNQAALDLLMYKKEDLVNHSISSVYPKEALSLVKAKIHELIKNGNVRFEVQQQKKDGSLIEVEIKSSAIRDEDGVVTNFVGMVRDITEKKEREKALLKSEERLTMATSFGNIGIWDRDLKNNVLLWDDSMYQLYGLEKTDFSNTYDVWEKSIHRDDIDSVNKEVEKALSGEKEYNTVFRILTSSGDIKYIQAKGNVQFNEKGEPLRMLGVNFDVTDREEAEIEKHNAIIKTEEAERQRISHDLHDGLGQTIAAASMFMNAMECYAIEQFDEEAMSIFKTGRVLINKAAKETRLVSHNIMPRSLKDFGLDRTVTEMVNNYQLINSDINIGIDSNLKSYRFNEAKELTIFRALQESINNAIKHSGASHINCVVKKTENELKFSVIDDGKGFNLKEIRKNGNVGIGLISLDQRIKMIGGKLEIKSSEDNGTEINISVALNQD